MDAEKAHFRMDKTVFSAGPLGEEPDDRAYWLSKTPQERLAAVEFLRQVMFGYDPTTERLQRIIEFAPLEES